nr:biotin/lipoyl-binding carrier protein [Nakamurella leprariae]
MEVTSELAATVWKVEVAPGAPVQEEDTLLVLESMKMEIPVLAEGAGVVREIRVQEGDSVEEGDVLLVLE